MKLSRIRTALVVSKEGSFTRAAARLHVAQSSISDQVALLEEELGFSLFARSGRGVQVSERGRSFLLEADRVYGEVLGLTDHARRLRGDATEVFTLALVSGIGEALGEAAIAQFQQRFRATLLRLPTGPPSRVCAWIDDDQADAGLVMEASAERLPAGLVAHPVAEQRLALIAPPDHPLARAGRAVDLGALVLQPMVMSEPDHGIGALVNRLFRDLGIRPSPVAVVDNVDVMKRLVRAGLGVAVVPAACVAREAAAGELAALPLAQAVTIPLLLLRRVRPMSRLREQKYAALRRLLSDLARRLPDAATTSAIPMEASDLPL